MTFIIGTFQSHYKSERNQEKQNHTGHVQIWQYFFICEVVHCLNDC